ncbi:MAG: inorganic phosphate transporter [Gemmataceae bacterium]|nr:inorganic phosphate transporter [Gemmataceae bacterium]
MSFWDAASSLPTASLVFLAVALLIAFGFEFINGFHDTANAVTTVIYTRTLSPTPAVIYSGVLNFLGALMTVVVGTAAVAFTIVNLLPVDLLIRGTSGQALVMVLSLLLAGVIWNLGTWYLGLPVSSSHTLIGAILGVGLANGLLAGEGAAGLNWDKVGEVLLALVVSPAVGFALAALLLLVLKRTVREPRLYVPPAEGDRPPRWVRGVLLVTCGGVSFAHGSNDGQKGMGLILLVLIGFLPAHYAVNIYHPELAGRVYQSAVTVRDILEKDGQLTPELRHDLDAVTTALGGKGSFADVPADERWKVRQAIYSFRKHAAEARLPAATRDAIRPHLEAPERAVEFVPLWVVAGVAVALGVGTTIGYKRIVVTVAEKIGKTRLTYGQGAAAGAVTAATVLGAGLLRLPVSTTHIMSSGVAGTMAANGAGVQKGMVKKIALAWLLTLPASMALSGLLYTVGRQVVG